MKSAGEDIIRDAVVNAGEAEDDDKGRGSRDLRLAKRPLNDSGNGERLRTRFGRDLMYVPEVGRYAWSGKHWSPRTGERDWHLAAQKTYRAIIWQEAPALQAELAESPGDKAELKEMSRRVHELRDFGNDSGNRSRLSSMQLVSEPHLERRVDTLDADPFLLNVQNGTLELGAKKGGDRTAVRLRKHSRLDHITRLAPIGYDADAECPLFRAFLDTVIPDKEVQDWLQRWFGYGLTADYSEEQLALFWGEGRNGKGVLTKLFQWLLGDYSGVIQFSSLLNDDRRRGSEATPDLAKLPGIRMVFAGEPKKGSRLDDGMVKQITGGDDLTVRHLNKEFFDLKPTFKLTLAFNNKPQIRDDTHGMWSRVRLVPFEVIIPPERQDRELLRKLKAEGPGVLNWALDGFRRWREIGLVAPQAILAATAEYRSESDRIGQFLEAATIRDPGGMLPARELLGCYEAWCRAMEYKPISQTLFGKELSKRGIKAEKHGIIYRLGLKWNPSGIDWDWQAPMEGL